MSRARQLVAEGLGTALLLVAVVGSGIMGEDLAGGNAAIALLANSIASGAALVALILAFGEYGAAHFNPVVTLASAALGRTAWREVPQLVAVQLAGAFGGVIAAHLMFARAALQVATRERSGSAQFLGEVVATFGLLLVIAGSSRRRADAVPCAVGAWITGAYWFTSSTSFANPAVTLARAATDTFTGIRAADVLSFLAAQLVGAALATLLCRWLARGR